MTTDKTYYRNLDALRFFAVLAVFLFHYYNASGGTVDSAGLYWFAHIFRRSGYLGVDFFYTLSGFLITSILISQSGFDLGRFYIRRGLRIVPLYLLIALIAYMALPFLLRQNIQLPPITYILTFTANYFYAWHGDHYLFAITILWSISVEMQFYLLWGGVLRFLRLHIYLIAAILIVVSLIVKYFLFDRCSIYYITETYIPDFMIGTIGAKMMYEQDVNFARIYKGWRVCLYLVAIALFILTPDLSASFWWHIFGHCFYAFFATAIILDQCSGHSIIDLGKSKLINHFGKVSYGMYCFQGIVLPLYSKLLLPYVADAAAWITVFVVPFILFAVIGILSTLSYYYFESIFLRLKTKL